MERLQAADVLFLCPGLLFTGPIPSSLKLRVAQRRVRGPGVVLRRSEWVRRGNVLISPLFGLDSEDQCVFSSVTVC